MDLIKSYHVDAPEVREMKELKLEIEQVRRHVASRCCCCALAPFDLRLAPAAGARSGPFNNTRR